MFFGNGYRFPSNIVYVDSKAPAFGQDGSASNPFRTLKDAIRKVNKSSTSDNPWGILLSPGNYKIKETLTVTAPGVSIQGFDHSSSKIHIDRGIVGLHIKGDTNFHKISFNGGETSILVTSEDYIRGSYCYFNNTSGAAIVIDKGMTLNLGLTESRFSGCKVGIHVKKGSKLALATTIFQGSGKMYARENVGLELDEGSETALTNCLISHCDKGVKINPAGTLITTASSIQDCDAGIHLNGGIYLASSGFLHKNKYPVILENKAYCNLKAVTTVQCENAVKKDATSIFEDV